MSLKLFSKSRTISLLAGLIIVALVLPGVVSAKTTSSPVNNAVSDRPIVGDWNGDGQIETGVYRPGVGFYLNMDDSNTWKPATDRYLAWDNAARDLPIAGDWNGDGQDETGVYRPGAGFYLKLDDSNTWKPATDRYLTWDNVAGDLPVAGDWNGDGRDETGVSRGNMWYFNTYRNKFSSSSFIVTTTQISTATVATPTPAVAPVIQVSGDFGYTANPTGNPIGGGAGYTKVITETSAGVKYVVSTKAELLTALKSAKAGETVFVKGTAVIDMTGTPSVTIPAGVTLASSRGLAGSAGGLLKRTKNLNGGWEEPMLIVGGDNVRVTGLRLEGEMYPQDYGNNDVYSGSINEHYYLVGIYAENKKGFEVDNCELYGWAWSTISLRGNVNSPIPYIHHNYIHHNQARGEGYGVNLYGGNALIEANLFDYNRHDVTGAGMSGEQYEARYNHHLGHGNAIGATNYDVHQDEETGTGLAGNLFKIHHNTIDGGIIAMLQVRGMPKTGMYVYNNVINSVASDTGVTGNKPIFQTSAGRGNMFVTNNYWKGTLYPTDNGIVVYY